MSDLNGFNWPWPATLTEEEIGDAIMGLAAAAGYLESSIKNPAENYVAALVNANVAFVREYLENRQAGEAGYQQIAL